MKKNYLGIVFVLGLIGLVSSSAFITNVHPTRFSPVSIVNESLISTDIPRDIRIAIYDESNSTIPSYGIGAGGGLHNNATGMAAILELAGYNNIDLITVYNISHHCLVTAKYDVFIMVDNLPRENITHLVWDFWAGGGGLLSLDGSGAFLCYMGILPPEGAGSTGNGAYYVNSNDDLIINVRHPISQSYPDIGTEAKTILTNAGYIMWNWTALSASSIGTNLERIAYSSSQANGIGVLTYEPDSGGNVVSLSIDLETEETPEAYPLIDDAIDWLCPRPKARIAFDFSHMPRLGVDDHDMYTNYPGEYSELRNSSVGHGYTFDKLYPRKDGNITFDRLVNDGYAGYDLLIIVLPDYPYTTQEITDIDRWVLEGGSLLIFAESGQNSLFTDAVTQINRVIQNMDCQVNMDEYLVATFPITKHPHLTMELVNSLQMDLCGYVNITGTDAYQLWGTDGDITMAASEYIRGRVIVSADMNWAADAHITTLDNAQYLTNAINWLTASEVNVLLYTDEPTSLNYHRTPVAKALNDLRYQYYLTSDPDYLIMAINDQPWGLVIIDNAWWGLDDILDDLQSYVDLGGRLLMSSYRVQDDPGHGLWNSLGFEFSADVVGNLQVTHLWNAYHSIFNIPHNYTVGHFTPTYDYGDEGDFLNVTTGTALAGWYVIPTSGNASLVLGASGRTLYNAFIIDEFRSDLDDSTYPDNFELWENEIAFMMRPLLTSPPDVVMVEGDDREINWVWDPQAQLFGAPVYDFELKLNSSIQTQGHLGGAIEGGWIQDLSSLSPGLYIYEFSISGRFGFGDSDEVIVHIDEAPPTATTTTTTSTTTTETSTTSTTDTTTDTTTSSSGTESGLPTDIFLMVAVIGLAAIISILAAVMWKLKPWK